MYLQRPLEEFVTQTAARTPTPGGGSVSALIGALGGALLSMVGNFTVDKEKYQSTRGEMQGLLDELKGHTEKLCALIAEDIEAYELYARARQLPKNNATQQRERSVRMQAALKQAAQVPLGIAEQSVQLLRVGERLVEIGNAQLVSDVGVGALAAHAALESAVLNVRINLGYLKDEHFVEETDAHLLQLVDDGNRLTKDILARVHTAMSA